MARIKVNEMCNVVTAEDSRGYVRSDGRCAAQITVPGYRMRLSIESAERLAGALFEAVVHAKELREPGKEEA